MMKRIFQERLHVVMVMISLRSRDAEERQPLEVAQNNHKILYARDDINSQRSRTLSTVFVPSTVAQ